MGRSIELVVGWSDDGLPIDGFRIQRCRFGIVRSRRVRGDRDRFFLSLRSRFSGNGLSGPDIDNRLAIA
jgi:hypothetical protein